MSISAGDLEEGEVANAKCKMQSAKFIGALILFKLADELYYFEMPLT
jgi:hypothetical protein